MYLLTFNYKSNHAIHSSSVLLINKPHGTTRQKYNNPKSKSNYAITQTITQRRLPTYTQEMPSLSLGN